MQTVTYGISAVRVENDQETDLLQYRAVTDFRDIDDVCAEFHKTYRNCHDVRIDVQTHRPCR